MDNNFTERIGRFLQLENPTDEEIRQGATMLLQCNPGRERNIYNCAMKRPKAMLPWIRTDLKKYYDIRKRGLTPSQTPAYNAETVKVVKKTLSVRPENVKDDGTIPVLGIRGKRNDHDQLPENIQEIWERNAERWKKMRQLHAQLAQMIIRPDYAPCDGNELCYQLRQADDALRNDYAIYDGYKLTSDDGKPEQKDSVEVFTDNVKTIQNARTAISRGLARKTAHTDESLKKIQDAVNTLFAMKQSVKEETLEKLKAIGIVIPEN